MFFSWRSCCHERIWNNSVEIQWKTCRFWSVWGYYSLGEPNRQHKVWRKTCLGKVILVRSWFWALYLCKSQTSYLKDNSWMSILHQYHKTSELKACIAMCRSEKWKWGNTFKMAGDRFVVHISCAVWGEGGGIAVVKEYEIITFKYIGNAYMLCLLWFGAPEDIIHWTIRPGSLKFEGKYFYKLVRSKGWKHTENIPSD